jgi:hypothetical protein
MSGSRFEPVMAGLVPVIHGFAGGKVKAECPGQGGRN